MFAEIQFTKIRVEVILADYLARGDLRSRGDIVIFLNDRNYPTISLYNCELRPLAPDRRVETVKQKAITLVKSGIRALGVQDEGSLENAQLTLSARKVVFHVGRFAINGMLHVPADAPDEDLLDETRDFFGVSKGSVYPIQPVATVPVSSFPLILVNRQNIQAYSVQES